MIAQPRTGTTVFGNLVNKQRTAVMYREAFHPAYFKWGWYSHLLPKIQENPKALLPTHWDQYLTPYLTALYEAKERNRKLVVGIDVKITQAETLFTLPRSIRECGAGVLHMRRRNTLAAIVSYRIMAERVREGARAHGTSAPEIKPVQLNLDWLKCRIATFESQDNMVKWTYRDHPYMELFYEDFIGQAGWQNTCTRLTQFFGTRFEVPFAPRLQKQNPAGLASLIKNHQEVRKLFPQFFDTESEPA
jgi:hypothetical protein